MIDPAKYGTASEVAEAVGKPRTTLISAAGRGEIAAMRTLAQKGYIDPDLCPEEAEQQRSPLEELPNGELRDHAEERANSEILTEE